MTQTNVVGKIATSIRTVKETGLTEVTYHHTAIVRFDDRRVILENDGYYTATTKKRMNQASNQFNLGFSVFQVRNLWFVTFQGETLPYHNGMVLQIMNDYHHAIG